MPRTPPPGANASNPVLEQKLRDAAARGDSGSIRKLALLDVDMEAKDENGMTAFNLATHHGHHDAALTLLAAREIRFMRRLGIEPQDFLSHKNHAKNPVPPKSYETVESHASQTRKA